MKSTLVAALLLASCQSASNHSAPPPDRSSGHAGASTTTGPLVLGSGPLLARGTITRELSPHSDNRPFVLAPGNHLDLELRTYAGEDRPAPLALQASVTLPVGTLTLPLAYELHGTLPSSDDTYLLHLEVHSGGSERPLELVSEYANELAPGVHQLDVVLTGLEPCDAPNAGGFCG